MVKGRAELRIKLIGGSPAQRAQMSARGAERTLATLLRSAREDHVSDAKVAPLDKPVFRRTSHEFVQ
jgi:hypothetical protein